MYEFWYVKPKYREKKKHFAILLHIDSLYT